MFLSTVSTEYELSPGIIRKITFGVITKYCELLEDADGPITNSYLRLVSSAPSGLCERWLWRCELVCIYKMFMALTLDFEAVVDNALQEEHARRTCDVQTRIFSFTVPAS